MKAQILPNAVSELFAQVSHSGRITLADRYGLMAALLEESLEEEQRNAIDRLIRALCKGRIVMVDELSAIA